MKEFQSLITVVGDDDTILGKCNLCSRNVINDKTKFWCAQTRMINLKLFCGGCLLELWETVEEVNKKYMDVFNQRQHHDDYYYSIDEATGRLVMDEVNDDYIKKRDEYWEKIKDDG